MEENSMRKLKFYTFIMPGSIPGLVKSVKEKKLPGLTYIGSVTELRNGEYRYEGITGELKRWIKEQVEDCRGKTLATRGGWKVFVEDDGFLDIGGLVFVKPDLPCWFDALASVLKGAKVPGGEELHAELEYLDETQEKESKKAWKKLFKDLDEHLTWPEFIKRFPKLWETWKKYRPELVKRLKKKYPELKETIDGGRESSFK